MYCHTGHKIKFSPHAALCQNQISILKFCQERALEGHNVHSCKKSCPFTTISKKGRVQTTPRIDSKGQFSKARCISLVSLKTKNSLPNSFHAQKEWALLSWNVTQKINKQMKDAITEATEL